ncbi:MAG: hypothetical protein KF887_16620 [Paracoccaceae bacterium]|nr:MAG: hypothetical protein KF887_16620 [Paracoccaceae bacterium]
MRFPDRAACLAVLIAAVALAGPASADEAARMRSATLADSERLRLRAVGQALSAERAGPAEIARMRHEMVRQGYYFDGPGIAVVETGLWAAPLLSWDGNINGGVLQDRFWQNDLLFEADPAFRARAGVVAGASAGGQMRLAWANGRVIELRSQAEFAWSPEHDLYRGDAALALCSRNHVTGWTFLDLCARGSRSWRDLGDRSAWQASVGLSRVIAAPRGLHELGIGLARTGGPDRQSQDQIALSVESVWDHATSRISLTLGEPVAGETALDRRMDAGLAWHWNDRAWRFDLWHQSADGGAFLGVPRRDRASGASIGVEIRAGTELRLGYARNRSTAGFAEYDQFTVDLRFGRLRF